MHNSRLFRSVLPILIFSICIVIVGPVEMGIAGDDSTKKPPVLTPEKLAECHAQLVDQTADDATIFADPRTANEEGILTDKLPLNLKNLAAAYRRGIFPWGDLGETVTWHAPAERGILKFSNLHVSSNLASFMRKMPFRVTFDTAFEQVIRACSESVRKHADGTRTNETWITNQFIQNYIAFHKAGYAHSIEVWNGDRLVGGTYGVHIDGVYAGESMFFLESNASKVALVSLVKYLESRGIEWMDTQVVTNIMGSFGAQFYPREEHLQLIEAGKAKNIPFYADGDGPGRSTERQPVLKPRP